MSENNKGNNKKKQKDPVFLEDKIKIMERFAESGEKINGKTVFEGYPIGQWAIQIRNSINRYNSGKTKKKIFNATKEQLDRLNKIGVLERQIEATIDEKIYCLIDWKSNYPKADYTTDVSLKVLKDYLKDGQDFNSFINDYIKMKRFYNYVKSRFYKKKLDEETINTCKEGNVGGVFGYPSYVDRLAEKYNVQSKDINYIIEQYGSIDNFYDKHNEDKIEGWYDKALEENIIINVVDVDENNNPNYEKLFRKIVLKDKGQRGLEMYSSNELKNTVNNLGKIERDVINSRYILEEDEKRISFDELGKNLGVSGSYVGQIESRAIRQLARILNLKEFRYSIHLDKYLYSDEELEQIENEIEDIKKDIQLQNGVLSDNIAKLHKIEDRNNEKLKYEKVFTVKDVKSNNESKEVPLKELIRYSRNELVEAGLDYDTIEMIWEEREKFLKETDISSLDLSIPTHNCLYRAGVRNLKDLIVDRSLERILEIRNMGNRKFAEISNKVDELGFKFETMSEKQERKFAENNEKTKVNVYNLNLSTRSLNCLLDKGIVNLNDLSMYTVEEILNIKGLGEQTFKEIYEAMSEYGVSFKNNKDEENNGKDKNTDIEKSNDNKDDVNEKGKLVEDILSKQKILDEQEQEINDLKEIKKVGKDEE